MYHQFLFHTATEHENVFSRLDVSWWSVLWRQHRRHPADYDEFWSYLLIIQHMECFFTLLTHHDIQASDERLSVEELVLTPETKHLYATNWLQKSTMYWPLCWWWPLRWHQTAWLHTGPHHHPSNACYSLTGCHSLSASCRCHKHKQVSF